MDSEMKRKVEALTVGRFNAAQSQIYCWARAWVQNETCIPETPTNKLSQDEQDAVLFLQSIGLLP